MCSCLLTTAEVANLVGFSEEWVREHAAELGGIRTGTSKHSRLRFEPEGVETWKDRHRIALPEPEPRRQRRRPGPRRAPADVELLPLPENPS